MSRRLIAFFYLLTLGSVCHAFTFGPTSTLTEPDFLPVEKAFALTISPPKEGKLDAIWSIENGYYLYQEQFSLSGDQARKLRFAVFAEGETKRDPYFGDVIIYRNQFTLPIHYDTTLAPGTLIKAVLSFQGCADRGLCYAPQKVPLEFTVPLLSGTETNDYKPSLTRPSPIVSDSALSPSQAQSVSQMLNSNNIASTLLAVFGLGLLLALTPCVLPMVPIVSAIVVGTRHSKLGALYYSTIYVIGMALSYAAIGGLVGVFGTQLNLQAQLQNPILLSVSALLFVLLALAMFDVYQLSLPSSWQQRLQLTSASNDSSWRNSVSIFFAGVLSTLIVSPCVSAPLAGALLYIGAQGNAWYGAIMLFVMALGMGIPLLIVGLFGPKILPKNGEWLQDIKVIMGFSLLAMAVWLATRWLPFYTHLYLWGTLAVSASGYFFHRNSHIPSHPVRWFLALMLLIIGIMEILGGATGSHRPLAPLKHLTDNNASTVESANLFDETITRLEELDAIIAKQDGRPIVLDLYADWCVSCKVIEDMFLSPEIRPKMHKIQLIRVDVTNNSPDNKALMKKFNLFGPPSLVFLDKQGKERTTLTIMGQPSKTLLNQRIETILSLD
ncbi:protein-disulfide reductase DsbD [Marinomonas sp. IMCC 4694]|nr:protein-disulfide reductase DsbD [Marinomonas sp. IMCC 4694]